MWPNLKLPWGKSRPPANEHQEDTSPPEKFPTAAVSVRVPEPHQIDGHRREVTLVTFSNDGKHIVSASTDGTIRRWNIEGGLSELSNDLGRPIDFEGAEHPVTLSKNGRWTVQAGSEGRRVTVYDTDSETHQRVVESVEQHKQKILSLDVSPDSTKIASGSQDGEVIVWCLETGRSLAGPFKQGPVWSVKFSPNGERLASAGWDFSVRIWNMNVDCRAGNFVTRIPTDPVYSLTWSSNGCRLFVGCFRGSIMCFDVATESKLCQWTAHVDAVSTLCLSNNGKFLVSACNFECTAKVWDVQTQNTIGPTLDHSSEVLTAAISPDDSLLVSGGKDGRISLWNLRQVIPPGYFFYPLLARLTPQSDTEPQPILTSLSNAAYEAWRHSDWAKAEEILSREIKGGWSPVHVAHANRALLRVRSQHWEGALQDAQGSIDIKPSLAAFIAKSFALSGQAKSDLAIETIDFALHTCEPNEQDFVTLVKSILLFEVGRREDGEKCVNELVRRAPHVKESCTLAQAKMIALLAEDATRQQDYLKTIQLLSRVRDVAPLCPAPEISTIALITGWVFDDLKFSIHRKWIEACYATGRTHDVMNSLPSIESELRGNIRSSKTIIDWLSDIKTRCVQSLEDQGDDAMIRKNYDAAVTRYSEALSVNSSSPLRENLFVKRSKALVAIRSWESALKDADEATRLNPSSHAGYECKHAALHGLERYDEAIASFETMLSRLEGSPDPEIRRLRNKYMSPSETKKAIQKALKDSVQNSPFRLIDTNDGRLCDPEKRRNILEKDPILKELISSTTTQLDKQRINTVIGSYSRYVMLSHRWDGKEPELPDVLGRSVYHLDPSSSPPIAKLQKFCTMARNAGFRWAWSDTCCIDKEKDVEFAKAINSMFRWYHSSSLTIVYLSGVSPRSSDGSLKRSVWMTRGWTLQELLAPPVIRFYYEDWTPYLNDTSFNHKESDAIMQELADVTGVIVEDLRAFRPGCESIRLKLRLASRRDTTVPVDVAYSLFGIFDVTMPIIHGESQQHALGRLLQSVVSRSGDVSCLSWVGRPSEFNSALPATINVYENSPHTMTPIGEEEMESWVLNRLTKSTTDEEERVMAFYHRLDKLPTARFAHQRLHLPCIVFPLNGLTRDSKTEGIRVYCASTRALEDTVISTAEKLPSKEGLCLVCPWIHELLASEMIYTRRSAEPESYTDTESDLDVSTSVSTLHRSTTSDFLSDDSAPLSAPPQRRNLTSNFAPFDDPKKALRLLARFSKPFGAFLLLAHSRGHHRRVATDCEIIIRVREGVSLDAIDIRTLEIL